MAETKKVKKGESWKAKKWFPIIAPRVLKNAVVGETLALELADAIGRKVTLSLMALLGDMKRQNINVTVTINRTNQGKLLSEMTGYEVMPSSVKRFIRRGRDRIDDSLTLMTGDGLHVAMNTLAITKSKTTGSKITLLRKLGRSTIKEYAKKITYEELLNEVLGNKIQKTTGEILSKVYPLRNFEIRRLELTSPLGNDALEAKKSEVVQEKKEEGKEPAPKTEEETHSEKSKKEKNDE